MRLRDLSSAPASDEVSLAKRVHQEIGVQEYYLFDPLFGIPGERLLPAPLIWFRRDESGLGRQLRGDRVESPWLGLRLIGEDRRLRVIDIRSGEKLLYRDELDARDELRAQEIARRSEEIARRSEEIDRRSEEVEALRKRIAELESGS